MFLLGLLFFCECFYRLKSQNDKNTWWFLLMISMIVIFLGLTFIANGLIYKNKIETKKAIKKLKKQRAQRLESNKLEIQKSPQN
jgi:phosphotransferase system  glucose/maltose/N-acetylglucosamine-specific IIC component